MSLGRWKASMSLWRLTFCVNGLILVMTSSRGSTSASGKRPNVILIISDDLRPEVGAYYDVRDPYSTFPKIRTPSLNALASRSILFRHAYVQQAICAPSRVSFLTSRRPDTTRVYTIQNEYWRNVAGNFVTIPQFFRNQGYRSVGIGKVFHHGSGSDHDDPPSWSEEYQSVPRELKANWHSRLWSWRAVKPKEREQQPLPDDFVTDRAVETLKRLGSKARGDGEGGEPREPFFMAVGFYKPHLPFVFPQQYLDLYPPEDVTLPRRSTIPDKMPNIAWNGWEIRKYPDIARLNISGDEIVHSLPVNVTRQLRRAYYCSVSYVDDLVGRVLWEVDRQGLRNNTVVAFIGDHGWHLGEGNLWGKHTNFEFSTRAPMMIRVPGRTDAGLVHDKPVEFVDLFPTLVEAAGFPSLPVCPEDSSGVELCTEGASLMELMVPSKTAARRSPVKEFAFSQYPRRGFSIMGYSIRTDRFRYTEWIRRKTKKDHVVVGRRPSRLRIVYAVELYDHLTDPEETVNLGDDRKYARHQNRLSKALQAGWRWALTNRNIRETDELRQTARVRRVTVRPPNRSNKYNYRSTKTNFTKVDFH